MSNMTYRGYSARVEYDPLDRILVGHLAGIRDIIAFHATTVDELEQAFHEAVDDYLAACAKLGQAPNRPFSGRMMLRLTPAVHARMNTAAQLRGISVNQWAAAALERAVQTEGV